MPRKVVSQTEDYMQQCKDWGLFIKEEREKKELSQREFGQLLGVSGATVGLWERGSNLPNLEAFIKLAELYDFTLDDLAAAVLKRAQREMPLSSILNYVQEKDSQAGLEELYKVQKAIEKQLKKTLPTTLSLPDGDNTNPLPTKKTRRHSPEALRQRLLKNNNVAAKIAARELKEEQFRAQFSPDRFRLSGSAT